MIKIKHCQTLPDPANTPIWSFSLSLSFSLSPSKTWPYQGWSHVSSLSLSPTPFILRISPGSC